MDCGGFGGLVWVSEIRRMRVFVVGGVIMCVFGLWMYRGEGVVVVVVVG